jgi:OPT family small oligopeptide transporter
LIISSSFCAQFYFFRQNRLVITSIAQIVLSYVFGICLDNLPLGQWNSRPFNYKEHTLIVIASSTATDFNYPIIAMMIQRFFLGKRDPDIIDDGIKIGTIAGILFIVLAEIVGVGLGGLVEKFLVYPADMWWPSNLVYANLIHTFHGSVTKKITRLRMRMFIGVLLVGFLYQIIPQIIAPLLGSISLICLLALGSSFGPDGVSTLLGQFGSRRGGGILSFSFDWSSISVLGPMYTPLWAQMNYFFASVLFSWILTPILYYSNAWNGKELNNIYGREALTPFSTPYNISAVLDSNLQIRQDIVLPPIRLSMNRVLVYGAGFATLTAVLSQFVVFYFRKTMDVFRMPLQELLEKDVHTRLMQKYPQVPWFWYAALFVCSTIGSIGVTMIRPSYFDSDWWVIPLAILMTMVFLIPIGIIQAVSNQSIGLNIISQLVLGYLKPGSIMANTTMKVFGTNTILRATGYLSQMKLAFYMKIPPRYVFFAHIWGLTLSAITSYITFDFLVPIVWRGTHVDLRDEKNWTSLRLKILWTAAQMWGVVSPKRFFAFDTPYWNLYFFFLVGAVLPFLFYGLIRRFPKFGFQYVNWPIIFQAVSSVGSGNANAIASSAIVAISTQYFVRKYNRKWYDRYNYIVSAGLDLVVAVVALLTSGLGEANWSMPNYILNPNPSAFGPDYCGRSPR